MVNKATRYMATALAVIFLSGCNISPPEQATPDLTFEQVAPVFLGVSQIRFVDEYQMPMAAPHVEHFFKSPPGTVVKQLVEKQVRATGTEHVLRVVIEDAAVTEKSLKTTPGVEGIFKVEPAVTYNARMALRFEMIDDAAPDVILGHARVTATRSTTLLEGLSPADRDRAFFTLTEQMMADISRGIQTTVRDTFGRN
jgi:hypothetical protein